MTPPEIALWLGLRANTAGLRFRRQHPAGPYVLDFYCAPALLAVEVDGEIHAHADRPRRDAVRDAWLAGRGVATLRYPARDVLADTDAIVRQVVGVAAKRVARRSRAASSPSVSLRLPPPPGGGG